jgi:hypothetical protein
MTEKATTTFKILRWDEESTQEIEGGGKLTQAEVIKSYRGEIEGQGTLTYLMVYHPDGNASFVGLERVAGAVAGRRGNFVFQHIGTFKGGTATDTWTVVPDSGTGDLAGLQGTVAFSAGHEAGYPVTFEYWFEGESQ